MMKIKIKIMIMMIKAKKVKNILKIKKIIKNKNNTIYNQRIEKD
jgi:hypothetical protein